RLRLPGLATVARHRIPDTRLVLDTSPPRNVNVAVRIGLERRTGVGAAREDPVVLTGTNRRVPTAAAIRRTCDDYVAHVAVEDLSPRCVQLATSPSGEAGATARAGRRLVQRTCAVPGPASVDRATQPHCRLTVGTGQPGRVQPPVIGGQQRMEVVRPERLAGIDVHRVGPRAAVVLAACISESALGEPLANIAADGIESVDHAVRADHD